VPASAVAIKRTMTKLIRTNPYQLLRPENTDDRRTPLSSSLAAAAATATSSTSSSSLIKNQKPCGLRVRYNSG